MYIKISYAIAILLVVYVIVEIIRTRYYITIGIGLANAAVPYEQHPSNSTHKILTIGDSSVVGTGSLDPTLSVAGRLGSEYPTADITNLGVNGTRTNELIERFRNIKHTRYDLIIIHTGGNDIVHFTRMSAIESGLKEVLDLANQLSDSVIVLHGGNVGSSKLFPAPTRWIYTYRTKKTREMFMRIASEKGVHYVDLYRERDDDPFEQDPKRYYAADYFHPSSEGYGVWYSGIQEILPDTAFGKSIK